MRPSPLPRSTSGPERPLRARSTFVTCSVVAGTYGRHTCSGTETESDALRHHTARAELLLKHRTPCSPGRAAAQTQDPLQPGQSCSSNTGPPAARAELLLKHRTSCSPGRAAPQTQDPPQPRHSKVEYIFPRTLSHQSSRSTTQQALNSHSAIRQPAL